MIVEADEFDKSFFYLDPLSIITSIDRDHIDTYHDERHARCIW